MNTSTSLTRRRYDRLSRFYDVIDRMIPVELRREVLAGVHGRVLEVGVGTGANLPLYPRDAEVTGVDLSPRMLAKARGRAKALGLAHVRLVEMDAEHLEFPDETFDAVVATCVFCSVPDPVKGLKEIGRVVKRDGQIVLLEHVRSEHAVVGAVMDAVNPIVVRVFGSNINRRTVENVREAGIAVRSVRNAEGPLVKLIVGGKPGDAEACPPR